MDQALGTVIGMTIAYVASGLGLLLAYLSYKKRGKRTDS